MTKSENNDVNDKTTQTEEEGTPSLSDMFVIINPSQGKSEEVTATAKKRTSRKSPHVKDEDHNQVIELVNDIVNKVVQTCAKDVSSTEDNKNLVGIIDIQKVPRKRKERDEHINPYIPFYDLEEKQFFKKLSKEDKLYVANQEKLMFELVNSSTPIRFRILMSKIDERVKSIAIKKLGYLNNLDESSSEYYKILNWITSVCDLPINRFKNLPVTYQSETSKIKEFLLNVKSRLDTIVYGHGEAKDQIIRLLAQWISNPEAKGMVIGIQGPMGCGKCHARDTPILMYDGTIKPVQDIQVGDLVMGDDSTPRNVLSLGNGKDMMYDIIPNDGFSDTYRVNSEHILCLKSAQGQTVEMTVKKYITCKNAANLLGYRSGIDLPGYDVQIHPYAIGAILGSACDAPLTLHFESTFVRNFVYCELKCHGMHLMFKKENVYTLVFKDGYKSAKELCMHILSKELPYEYIYNDEMTRMFVLAGYIDTAVKVNLSKKHNQVTLWLRSSVAAENVIFIARSVGILAKKQRVHDGGLLKCFDNNRKSDNQCILVTLKGKKLMKVPALRKCIPDRIDLSPNELLTSITVKPVGEGEYYGFTLDGNHRYLLGDFTVTHNTTLIKDGICQVLGLPFAFIPLGGASDGSYLDGHSYTYEGATWGKIVDTLMKCGCMNPVFYFDELDKVSSTFKGDEIINILIHLTDSSQNDNFQDKYFTDFNFDLSKSLIIFSYNDENNINPILRDRMIRIHTNGYSNTEKVKIAKDYMFPLILKEYNFNMEDVIINEEIVRKVTEIIDEEKGVRNLKRALQNIVSHINLNRILDTDSVRKPYIVTDKDVQSYVNNKKTVSTLPFMYT